MHIHKRMKRELNRTPYLYNFHNIVDTLPGLPSISKETPKFPPFLGFSTYLHFFESYKSFNKKVSNVELHKSLHRFILVKVKVNVDKIVSVMFCS